MITTDSCVNCSIFTADVEEYRVEIEEDAGNTSEKQDRTAFQRNC